MPPPRPRTRAKPTDVLERREALKKPWWQHWYVGAAVVPIVIGFLLLIVMGVQRLTVGSSNFYVATIQKAASNPIVVSKVGNGIEVEKVQHAEIPLFGGNTLLVLVVRGSRGQGRIVAVGHADSQDEVELKKFTIETLDGIKTDLLGRHAQGL